MLYQFKSLAPVLDSNIATVPQHSPLLVGFQGIKDGERCNEVGPGYAEVKLQLWISPSLPGNHPVPGNGPARHDVKVLDVGHLVKDELYFDAGEERCMETASVNEIETIFNELYKPRIVLQQRTFTEEVGWRVLLGLTCTIAWLYHAYILALNRTSEEGGRPTMVL